MKRKMRAVLSAVRSNPTPDWCCYAGLPVNESICKVQNVSEYISSNERNNLFKHPWNCSSFAYWKCTPSCWLDCTNFILRAVMRLVSSLIKGCLEHYCSYCSHDICILTLLEISKLAWPSLAFVALTTRMHARARQGTPASPVQPAIRHHYEQVLWARQQCVIVRKKNTNPSVLISVVERNAACLGCLHMDELQMTKSQPATGVGVCVWTSSYFISCGSSLIAS